MPQAGGKMPGTHPSQQFRLRRLQVFNWGTFSKLHDIPIAEEGFLFVGRSGSGKSTLLDALSTLLVPPQWMLYNAAAREGDRGRQDRHLATYVRGAWADQKDVDSGEIATQCLRSGTTWSALAAEFADADGRVVSLIQLFWLRGSSNRPADVKRHYMVADRPFDIASDLNEFDLDLRKLKQRLRDVHHFDVFSGYGDHFRRKLGIESEMALKLLHKTQSAKNLSDLNGFVREFMLDRPETFEVAVRLVDEFAELDAAHQSVVTARKQIDNLRPAREDHQRLHTIEQQVSQSEGQLSAVDAFHDERRLELLDRELDRLHTQDQAFEGQERQQEEMLRTNRDRLKLLEDEHRQTGGARIEELDLEKTDAERQRNQRMQKRSQAQSACKELEWHLPDTAVDFAELAARAKELLERRQARQEQLNQQRDDLRDRKREAETEFAEVRREVEAMQRQPSNIPAPMLDLRRQLCEALDLVDADLPFAGELIEVKKDETEWRGGIERVLHGFALSILVNEDHYAAVSGYVNDTWLRQRLVYYRVASELTSPRQPPNARSLVGKVTIKEGSFRAWVEAELRKRFDYACVDNIREFRVIENALTREGQWRQGRARHEKDDRRAVDDRRYWVLGFDNLDKKRMYEERGRQLANVIAQLTRELMGLKAGMEREQKQALACQTLVDMKWHELDVVTVLNRIREITQALTDLRNANQTLKDLGDRINQQKGKVDDAESDLSETRAERKTIVKSQKRWHGEKEYLVTRMAGAILTEAQRGELRARYDSLGKPPTLDTLGEQRTAVERAIRSEQDRLRDEKGEVEKRLIRLFGHFLREWNEFGADLDESLESAPDFMELLKRLEHDDLPKHERRFFKMLREQSTENLAALNAHITDARKEIRARMDMVNESLAQVEFNTKTHLKIAVNDRFLPAVKEFRDQIGQVLDHAWLADPDHDREGVEARFGILRDLVRRLGSAESEHQRWKELVLDVRQHMEFMGHEYDAEGREIEIHRSGAGKSGGQREKLATTCLAAALRYQLGGKDGSLPLYAPVILDEAFGKADPEFTEHVLRIFVNFGFQLIVATPLKSVMTLEPFIGGACFVEITDRNRSATLPIQYDRQRHRLDLPEKVHGQAAAD